MKHPDIVAREQWRAARQRLLLLEKEHMRARDALNAQRRLQPMTLIESQYTFESTAGSLTFGELFEERPRLIIYHNMRGPWVRLYLSWVLLLLRPRG
jgi:predicted dithiol-disulfide oxidoreductase (DUF899 family)